MLPKICSKLVVGALVVVNRDITPTDAPIRALVHKLLIDCAKKSVKLTTPEGKEIEFIIEPVVTAKGDANRVKVNQLDVSQGSEMSVVNEFPDVFPEELPGMPPD
jgi:hypothetical protein